MHQKLIVMKFRLRRLLPGFSPLFLSIYIRAYSQGLTSQEIDSLVERARRAFDVPGLRSV